MTFFGTFSANCGHLPVGDASSAQENTLGRGTAIALSQGERGNEMADETQLLTEKASPRSWQPEVEVQGVWSTNALRFRTESEAKSSAQNLYGRWMLTTGFRAVPSDDEPTHEWIEDEHGGGTRPLDKPEASVYHAPTSVQL